METKPWIDNYPKGINYEIDTAGYDSLNHLFSKSFERYADLPAFENMGVSYTYRELEAYAKGFAAYIQQETDLVPGDRIAIQMPNVLQYPVALLGSLLAGLVVTNTNPLYTEREMRHQFRDSGAKAIVILSNFASKLDKVIDDTKIKYVFVTNIGDMFPGLKKFVVNSVVKYVKKMVPSYSLPGHMDFIKMVNKGKEHQYTEVTTKRDDLAFLQYTGGTTGVSKGAMLTHGNMIANMLQVNEWKKLWLEPGKEVVITPLPLYHIFSLTVNGMAMMNLGAKMILITNPRDIPGFVMELKKHKFTVMTGVNTLFNALLNNADFKKLEFGQFKVAVGGGMAVQKAVSAKWKELTGKPIIEGYGLTESSPVACCNPLDGREDVGTIGLPFPNTDIKIIDEDGKEVAQGEIGELCIKGPQVMKGYWNRDDETMKCLDRSTGWLKTGDIAKMETNGFFRIVDRKKDMINVSGFNVYPNEIEDVIALHPKVLEVAAIGVDDEKSVEAVKAFIVKKDESLTTAEIDQFCRDQLTAYKVPKHYQFKDELPKTNVGKILRRALREEEKAGTNKA